MNNAAKAANCVMDENHWWPRWWKAIAVSLLVFSAGISPFVNRGVQDMVHGSEFKEFDEKKGIAFRDGSVPWVVYEHGPDDSDLKCVHCNLRAAVYWGGTKREIEVLREWHRNDDKPCPPGILPSRDAYLKRQMRATNGHELIPDSHKGEHHEAFRHKQVEKYRVLSTDGFRCQMRRQDGALSPLVDFHVLYFRTNFGTTYIVTWEEVMEK